MLHVWLNVSYPAPDMGTGKTVQVIALLSALLEKTGTYADSKVLGERRKLANEWIVEQELAKSRALEQGKIFRGTGAPTPSHLPPWAPVLIFAPASILDNWITDSDTWGHFAVSIYQGKDQYSGLNDIRAGSCEILLASHTSLEKDNHCSALMEIAWKLVIVDEHHKWKNPKAKGPINLTKLRDAHHVPVLGLTGTVMQNNHKGKTAD